jgi:hypothetical protein
MEYALTWRAKATPAGRPYCLLRASNRRTKGTGCTGWPTPQVVDEQEGRAPRLKTTTCHPSPRDPKAIGNYRADLKDMATLAGWPTPNIPNRGAESRDGKDAGGAGGIDLQSTAILVGWTTPQQRDFKGVTQNFCRPDKPKDDSLPDQVTLAGWGTPRVSRGGYQVDANGNICLTIEGQATLAGWATPAKQNAEGGPKPAGSLHEGWNTPQSLALLSAWPNGAEQAGLITNSAGAEARWEALPSRAVLAAEHSLWLQGWPAGARSCVSRATESSPRSRRSS